MARRRRSSRRGLGTTAGMHCTRFKNTRAGRRCAKYSKGGRRGGLGTTAGMHCTRYKRTSAGRRCAHYA